MILVAATGAAARAEAPLVIRLRVRVARCRGAIDERGTAAQTSAWVNAHVDAVKALLAPHGIVVTATQEAFEPDPCVILNRQDRDAFAAHSAAPDDPRVDVLVVPRVRDLDVPTYDLMGVHWRAGPKHWIFLTARARPPVLAHELCHYFGLPHDPAGGNLMTPGPSSPLWRSPHPPRPVAPLLTRAQIKRLRSGISARRSLYSVHPRSFTVYPDGR